VTSTRSDFAFAVFERVFKDYGVPDAIRTDNGAPFASANALFGLSKLSVWWLRLGIHIQRIKPGHPQQNGRHERMHLTLKQEATKPASCNFLQQQERFEHFIRVYNKERPHQALNGACPADLYTPSARLYQPPPEPDYPFHDRTVRVAAVSASENGKSTSAPCSPASSWGSGKSTTTSGWSASCTMI
jgi:transposase InsO family protein